MSKSYTAQAIEDFVYTIKRNLELFKRGTDTHIHHDLVLVVGSTGSGKSTIMNIITGKPVVVFKEDEDSDLLLDVEKDDYAGEIRADGFAPVSIGHGGDAKTRFSNYAMIKGIQFWDCPGFYDTRGPEVEISNLCCINHILNFNSHGQVRFVIVQNSAGVREAGGKSFRETISSFCKMLPEETNEALIAASTFVFTRVSAREPMGIKYLNSAFTKVTVEQNTENEKVLSFVRTMKKSSALVKHVEIPKILESGSDVDGAGSNLDEILSAANSVASHSLECSAIRSYGARFPISSASHLKLLEICSAIKQIITSAVQTVVSKLIQERVEVCYSVTYYNKQVTDSRFKPLVSNIKDIATQKQSLFSKLRALSSEFANFAKINLSKLKAQQIEDDMNFVTQNMTQSLHLADAEAFLSTIMSPDLSTSCSIDEICLSLVGEVETYSTSAMQSCTTEALSKQSSSWCIVS